MENRIQSLENSVNSLRSEVKSEISTFRKSIIDLNTAVSGLCALDVKIANIIEKSQENRESIENARSEAMGVRKDMYDRINKLSELVAANNAADKVSARFNMGIMGATITIIAALISVRFFT